jgi:hypothetical protein
MIYLSHVLKGIIWTYGQVGLWKKSEDVDIFFNTANTLRHKN